MNPKLSLFEETNIRKTYKNNKWYYSLNDFISYYVGVSNPSEYLNKLKNKDKYLKDNWEYLTIDLNMKTIDNKIRKTLCTDNLGILRIIENIISPQVDNFKLWIARLGEERIEEINNPEILMDKMNEIYKLKGYSDSWINQREKEITIRHSLKEEWMNRNINLSKDYKILMNQIYKNTFDKTIEEYKKTKSIDNNILDSMNNLELALFGLSEILIVELHNKNKSNNLEDIKKDINEVGNIIDKTKKELEKSLDKKIVSHKNYNNLTNK